MNKARVATLAVKTAKRYQKPTVKVAKFAVRHRKGLLQSLRATRKAHQRPQRPGSRHADA